jgi:hypothetical protein
MGLQQALFVLRVGERLGRCHHSCADPHALRAIDQRVGHVRARGDPAGCQHHQRPDGANDSTQKRYRSDHTLVVSARLPALRNHGIDAKRRRLLCLLDGCRLLPHTASRIMQLIDPAPRRNIHVKDDQLYTFGTADVDVSVGRRGAKGGGVMQQVHAKEARRSCRDHPDELLCAGRRFDGIPQDADAACGGNGSNQRRVRNKPHPRADERIPDAVIAGQPRAQ